MSANTSRNQGRQDLIFISAPSGILLLNDQLEIIESNPALLESLDYQKDDLCARRLIDLCHPSDRMKLDLLLRNVDQQKTPYTMIELRLQRNDGAYLWVELTARQNQTDKGLPGSYVVIAKDIQERKEIEQDVLELRRRLNKLAEEERVQLAQELHDGPMQDLHSTLYQLSALRSNIQEASGEDIDAVLDSVRQVSSELRRISYDLRPPGLSRFGLAKSIRSHAEDFRRKHPNFAIELSLIEDGTMLTEEIRLALFRIYQQAMGNILQHSGASEIEIKLLLDGDIVELRIQDNGTGFHLPERWISFVRDGHFGLAGSRDRVNSLGGDFEVQTTIGQGTTLIVRIPECLEES